MLIPLPFIFIRHGQTDWNLESRTQGRTDIPLNATGIAQAHQAKKLLKGHSIDTICYSPLLRAKQTAEILNEELNCKMICIEDLAEFHLGHYEGRTKGQWFEDWKMGKITENVEPIHEFLQRALNGINTALSYSPNVLIVAHGGIYWAIKQYLPNEDFDIHNCVPVLHYPPNGEKGWERQILKDLT